jgi:protein-L-isoaspartate(D-aspartate) O-methyltransferase
MSTMIQKAFKEVDRRLFVLPTTVRYASIDAPLDIGYGQTISQPYTVRLMLEWLDVKPGQKILDVGSGSGWTTALLGVLVGSKGQIYGVERISQLVKYGRNNLKKQGTKNAMIYQATKKLGLPQFTPYDRILVSASAANIPLELLDQLASNGKMVIPVGYSIMEISKTNGIVDVIEHPGFVFVPLIP